MDKNRLKQTFCWNMGYSFLSVVFILCMICVLCLPGLMDGHHTYNDFLMGENAYLAGNKSGEWKLFWILLAVGCVGMILFSVLEKKRTDMPAVVEKKSHYYKYGVLCFVPCLVHLIVYGKTTVNMLIFSCVAAVLVCVFKEQASIWCELFICTYFALQSVSAVMAVGFHNYFLGDSKILAMSLLILFSVVCATVFRKAHRTGWSSEKIISYIQVPIPLLLLVYLKDDYERVLVVTQVKLPVQFVCLIYAIIVLGILYNVWRIVKEKKSVSVITVFCVFAFVSFSSVAQIMPNDFHHHGEQILAWQQIIELGQVPYQEYSPASGFYPMIIGAINSLFFAGEANTYALSFGLFMLLFEALTVALLYKRLAPRWCLFLAVLFRMPLYCRTWILLPVLLILTDRKLVKEKIRWLISWVLCSFLSGLYYPLYGAALMFGAMPFGIAGLIQVIRQKEWKRMKKTEVFLALFVMILIVISIPLLYRMMRHILSMAGQTLSVDGATILDTEPPAWFMPYLMQTAVRDTVYYTMRIILGIVFLLIPVYLLSAYLLGKYDHGKIKLSKKLNDRTFLLLSAVPIVLCVCYTYTMVCMDEDWVANILSRSAHVILFVCGMFGVVVLKEVGMDFMQKSGLNMALAMTVSIPFFFFYNGGDYYFPALDGATDTECYVIGEYSAKLIPYQVPEAYVLLTDEVKASYPQVDYTRVGSGFVQPGVLQNLNERYAIYDLLKTYDPDVNMLGFEMTQFYYYLLNEKAVYSGRTAIAKSAKATEAVISSMDTQHTVIRNGVIPLEQYYLYRYAVKQGYVYSAEMDLYLPSGLYRDIYGREGSLRGSAWMSDGDCGMVACAFGHSVDSMETCETVACPECVQTKQTENGKIVYTFSLSRAVNGADVDFVRVKLRGIEPETEGTIYWNDVSSKMSDSLAFDVCDGELLIPVGIHAGWLTDTHDEIQIVLEGMEQDTVTMEQFAFYRLK